MTIVEAMRKVTPEWPLIARKAWFFPYNAPRHETVMVRPMNGARGCLLEEGDRFKSPWTPTAEDLLADDWCTVKARPQRV